MTNTAFFEQRDVFVAKGREHYRIPSMVVANDGTILAFANRRMDTVEDQAEEVHLVMRRSVDGGATWEPTVDLFAKEGWVAGIGTATVDVSNGSIMLSYSTAPRKDFAKAQAEKESLEFGDSMAISRNSGRTWTHEKMSIAPNETGNVGGCHGSGTGITLRFGPKKGRLLMPAYLWVGPGECDTRSCAIYSDDHGKTWKTSGGAQVGTDETCIVETSGGAIYLNARTGFPDRKRRIAWSHDSGETFKDFAEDETLIEPLGGCNAGMISFPKELSVGKDIILFSNPACQERRLFRVRLSYDGGRTWPVSKIVNEGWSAYSSLAVSQDGTIVVLYERGTDIPHEIMISVARFSLGWLTDGGAS